MSKSRHHEITAAKSPVPAASLREFAPYYGHGPNAWVRFWFGPADPIGLHVLRVLSGLFFLYWLLPLSGHVNPLLSLTGWFDAEGHRQLSPLPGVPPVNWSILFLFGDQPSPALITAIYNISLLILAAYTLGIWPRLTSVLTWLVVESFLATPFQDDADWLISILALYPMLGYLFLGQRASGRSVVWRVLGPLWPFGRSAREDPFWHQPSSAANLSVRLIQVHFAIAWVVNGLHKLQFAAWWSGTALWFHLHPARDLGLADYQDMKPDSPGNQFILSLVCYLVLAWQIGFPVFAWRHGWWRIVLLGGAVVGWLGTIFVLGDPMLGPVVMILCLSYLTPAEWRRVTDPLTGWLHRSEPVVAANPHAITTSSPGVLSSR